MKIIVIGCPGSGKSSFSRALRDKTGLPLYHLDMLWHKPDKTNNTQSEFDEKLISIINTYNWNIDGNYQRTLELRLSACDTVFLLDFPTEVCLSGVESRIGTKREDMPWVEEEFDPEFREYIIGFSQSKLPFIYQMLEKYKDKNIVIFKTRAEMSDYLDTSGFQEISCR